MVSFESSKGVLGRRMGVACVSAFWYELFLLTVIGGGGICCRLRCRQGNTEMCPFVGSVYLLIPSEDMNQAIRYGKCEADLSNSTPRQDYARGCRACGSDPVRGGRLPSLIFPAGIGDCDVQQFVRRVDAEFYDAAVFGIFYGDGQGVSSGS